MQALCPKCHQEKTASENKNMKSENYKQLNLFESPTEPIKLRRHQKEFLEICKLLKGGEQIGKIIMLVTPGGGKSLIPVIAAAQLIPSRASGGGFHGTIADAICWVVPRLNLQAQAERNFEDSYFKEQLNHQHRIRANNNEPNPCKGTSGYVATYHAIFSNPDLHAQELQRKRYILVLDEFHHVEEGSPWHQALQSLVDSAVLVVLVTGTHKRGDGKPIAFMPYKSINADRLTPDLSNSQDARVIRYTREDALREGAIVPLHFELQDGEAEWVDKKGQVGAAESIAEAGEDTNAAIWTALNTEYAYDLLTKSVQHWQEYKEAINPRSKLLVIAPSISKATEYVKWLKDLGIKALKATSDESKEAQKAIEKFKRVRENAKTRDAGIDVLVTVQMAYEGLDVPAITHIACLTRIRSEPWLEQAWARAARVDKDAGKLKTEGIIFVPDDELAHNCIEKILAEQDPILKEREQNSIKTGQGNACQDGNEDRQRGNSILPITSNLTGARALDLSSGETVDYHETERIQGIMQQLGISGISTIKMKQFGDLYSGTEAGEESSDRGVVQKETLTPREEEKIMRDGIEKYVRRYEGNNHIKPGTLNSEIKSAFNKSRTTMTIEELRKVWAWLQNNYPMGD